MPEELLTLPAAMRRAAVEHPDRDAVVTLSERLTWAELDRSSLDLAATLVARGVNRRHRVGLLMGNGPDWVTAAVAVMRIGAVLVPLSTLLRPAELEQQLRAAAVQHLIHVDRFRGREFSTDLAGISVPSLRSTWSWNTLPSSAERHVSLAAALEERVRPADDLAVLFTSGSNGPPKGTIHTHGSALRAVGAGLVARCVDPGDRLYLPMPLFWTGGFAGGLLTVLLAGATLLTEAVPTPEDTLQLLSRERATLFRGWPAQAVALAAAPGFAQADLRALKPGSLDPVLPPHLRSAPGARANLFGMTETMGPYCADRLDTDMPERAWGSCGAPLPGTEVRVVEGELQVRGPGVMRGVCGLSREQVFTRDGWYPTGDLGRIDDDGRVWYLGRRDDAVKVSGATVYPSEVEAALLAVPGVRAAFVTSVDGLVVAAIAPTPGASVDERGIRSSVRDRLSGFKVPSRVLVLEQGEDVARTASGKVDLPALRGRFAGPGTTEEKEKW